MKIAMDFGDCYDGLKRSFEVTVSSVVQVTINPQLYEDLKAVYDKSPDVIVDLVKEEIRREIVDGKIDEILTFESREHRWSGGK